MTRQEWLKEIKIGDRVQSVCDDPREARADGLPWAGTVVVVNDTQIGIYDDAGGEVELYARCDGETEFYLRNGTFRLEPLPSEWRKEPPDESGLWWRSYTFGGKTVVQIVEANLYGESYYVSLIHNSGPKSVWSDMRDYLWQKANVPAPPEDVTE